MYRSKGYSVVELIVSILLIIMGAVTLRRPEGTLGSIAAIYGILAIVLGILDIVVYAKLERRTGFGPVSSLITGILSILSGVLFLLQPVAGTVALAWLFPIWFISHCASRLMNLGLTKLFNGKVYFYFSLVLNILGLILGILLLFNPFLSAVMMVFLIGFYLTLLGVDGIVDAVRGLSA